MSRRVLVTGGAAGIGLAMARAFAAAGDAVTVTDRDPRACAAVPEGIMAIEADVTDETATARVFDTLGPLDVLCANAGTGGPAAPIEAQTLAGWRDTLAVNLDGAFLACRAAAGAMKSRGRGVILITSSTSGLFGHPERSPYAVAKWGLIGLARTLAMELGPHGIRVNAICPGAVEGDRMERVLAAEAEARGTTPEDLRATYARHASMRRWVTAEDVAQTAFWLASDAARLVSGQAIAVDGHTEAMR